MPIAVSLVLLCTMAGALIADANYINATYVSAFGTALRGSNATIAGVDV